MVGAQTELFDVLLIEPYFGTLFSHLNKKLNCEQSKLVSNDPQIFFTYIGTLSPFEKNFGVPKGLSQVLLIERKYDVQRHTSTGAYKLFRFLTLKLKTWINVIYYKK